MSRLRPPLSASDHLRGDLNAPLHLVELGDFECPFCGEAYSIVEQLREALGYRLCFAFRNFPLESVHPHALVAAAAAEAASAQGKFWEMHGMLYRHQDALEPAHLSEYAKSIGLDIDRFTHDLQRGTMLGKVRGDLRSGAVSGVNGTPAFFVNGTRHDGPFDYDTLYQALAGEPAADLIA